MQWSLTAANSITCVVFVISKLKKKSQHISLFLDSKQFFTHLLVTGNHLFIWSDILCEVQYVCVFGPHQQLRPVQNSAAKSPTMCTSSTLTVCVSSFAAEQEVCRVIVWAFWVFFSKLLLPVLPQEWGELQAGQKLKLQLRADQVLASFPWSSQMN